MSGGSERPKDEEKTIDREREQQHMYTTFEWIEWMNLGNFIISQNWMNSNKLKPELIESSHHLQLLLLRISWPIIFRCYGHEPSEVDISRLIRRSAEDSKKVSKTSLRERTDTIPNRHSNLVMSCNGRIDLMTRKGIEESHCKEEREWEKKEGIPIEYDRQPNSIEREQPILNSLLQ
jgi:hypothetical protein